MVNNIQYSNINDNNKNNNSNNKNNNKKTFCQFEKEEMEAMATDQETIRLLFYIVKMRDVVLITLFWILLL